MSTAPMPPRLHVLLARAAPLGLVFRRGPSKHWCTLLWDRRSDRFTEGHHLTGKLYPYRSDLSPKAGWLVTFAMDGHWASERRGAWTMVCRPPGLKPVGLYAKGDCWHGGGLFVDEGELWLNQGYGHARLQHPAGLAIAPGYPGAGAHGGECPGVYFLRLQRDGWLLVEEDRDGARFEKRAGHGWTLCKHFHAQLGAPPGKGVYWEEHRLRHQVGQEIALPEWSWAEIDGRRLVWAAEGRLWAARLSRRGLVDARLLADFAELGAEG